MKEENPGRKPVTRAAVAKVAGVSTAVVSYVLNDGPRPVAPTTRERVLRAIEELGYRPNAIARALKLRRTHTIALVVPDNSNPFFAELAKAIEDIAYSRGYAILLGNSSNDHDRERAQIRTLTGRQVDGLLLISASGRPDLSDIQASNTPVVLLDRVTNAQGLPSVVVDNPEGACLGVQHLIQHGHRRIACISGPSDLPAALDREDGWRRALRGHGQRVTARLVERAAFSRDGGYFAAQRLLSRVPRPTAIFASSDLQGIGALRACHEASLRVPEDVALLAFDGTQESEYTTPPMSVVRQPIEQIAAAAVDMLLRRDREPADRQVVLRPHLLLRRSCGCPLDATGAASG